MRATLKEGKSDLSDDVIDDLMKTFGSAQAAAQVKNEKQNIEKEIIELKRNPIYMDVEECGAEIRKLMKTGLSAEQAYWATKGAEKEKEEKAEQEKALNKERAQEGYVTAKPTGAQDKEQYTAKERAIADTLEISPEEVKARSKQSFGINEILSMNKKFKKGE